MPRSSTRRSSAVASPEPCGVTTCPAFADGDDGFCQIHDGAKRAGHVLAGTKCTACHRVIEEGDWLTRSSTASEMTHAVCPPKRPFLGRKVDRAKPLIEATEATDGTR